MTPHTPLPWQITGNDIEAVDIDEVIVSFPVQDEGNPTSERPVLSSHDLANATLIVTAVNAHEKLREQVQFCCEQLAECMEQNHGRIWDNANTVFANARALLASLEAQ